MQDSSITKSVDQQPAAVKGVVNDDFANVGQLFHFVDTAMMPQTDTSDTHSVRYINFYGSHEASVIHPRMDEVPYRDTSPDWLFYVLLFVVAALAWIRYSYGKIFGQTLRAIFNVNITNQIVRDENILLQRASAFLGILFNVVLAIILYHVSNYFHWNLFNIDNNFGRFLFLMLAVSAIYSFKFLLLKIAGVVFAIEKEMTTYIFIIFLINNMLGLLLIPLAILLSFSVTQHLNVLIITVCVLYLLSLSYRIMRGTLIGLSYKGRNLIYLFLYFCALEFAPFLVLLKILTR